MNSFFLRRAVTPMRWLIVIVLLLVFASLSSVASVATGSSTASESANARMPGESAIDEVAPSKAEGVFVTGSFNPTASMAQTRASHVAIRLLDGRVLVAGGGSDLRTAEIYDPATETWIPTGSLTYGRYGQAAVLLSNGRVMVSGGVSANVCSGPPVSNSAEIYDPATGVWTLTASMNVSRHQALAIVLADGRVLVAGGGTRCGTVYASAEIYDPTTNAWTTTGSMNVARELVRGVRLPDDRVLVAGGTGSYPFASLAAAEIYNPATGTWTVTDSLNEPRLWGGRSGLVVLPNGLVLAVGGYLRYCDVGTCDPPMTLSSAELYDPATGLWTFTSSLSHPRVNHETTLLASGLVLITGGADTGTATVFDSAELYDPATGTFAVIPATMTSARQEHSATRLADGRVLIAGGYQNSGSIILNSAEIYAETPDTGVNIAYNPTQTGYPHPLESDPGWGGGSYPWEILDGQTYYTDTWAHGLAFTGGVSGWVEPCGQRQATVDFGAMQRFSKVRVYHHGDEHVPTNFSIEYWDGSAWQMVNASSVLREDLRVPPLGVSGWGAVPTEHVFSAVTGSKVRYGFNNCDIEHGWIYEFEVYNATGSGPHLEIPDHVPGIPYQTVAVPLLLTRYGTDLATAVFSLDYDQACLQFDPTDADGDGNPDSVAFSLPPAFQGSVTFDGNDADGELDFFIADVFPPLAALPDGQLASIEFQVTCQPPPGSPILADVGFSNEPAASFGGTNGQSVPGTTDAGSVMISGIQSADCNTDVLVDAGDISATVLEIFDGDGNQPENAPGGTFLGNPVGCNANADTVIDAGDISCTVLLIFGGLTACESPLMSVDEAGAMRPAISPSLGLLEVLGNNRHVTLPIELNPGSYAISSLAFSLEYDPAELHIDPKDKDGNGIPDAIVLDLPGEFNAGVVVDNEVGLLNVIIADPVAPLVGLPQQVIARVTWQTSDDMTSGSAGIAFSKKTPASFGDIFGRSIPGKTRD